MEKFWKKCLAAAAAVGLGLLLAAAPASADETAGPKVDERVEKVRLVFATDGGKEVFDSGDLAALAEGQSREWTTESGRKIRVTRRGERLEVEVDGEKLDAGGGREVEKITEEGDGRRVMKKVIVAGPGAGEGMARRHGEGAHVFVFSGDGEEGSGEPRVMQWTGEGGGGPCGCGAGGGCGHGECGHGGCAHRGCGHRGGHPGPMVHPGGPPPMPPARCPMAGPPGGEAAAIDRVIERLEVAEGWKALDPKVREKVLALLAEQRKAAPVERRIEVRVIEKEDEERHEP